MARNTHNKKPPLAGQAEGGFLHVRNLESLNARDVIHNAIND